jgi:hypothetical protein
MSILENVSDSNEPDFGYDERRYVNYGHAVGGTVDERRTFALGHISLPEAAQIQTDSTEGEIVQPSWLPAPNSETPIRSESLTVLDPYNTSNQRAQSLGEEYLTLRNDYVVAMGWRPEQTSDVDAYDEDSTTKYYLKTSEDDKRIVCGMRLTHMPSLKDSLTWHMLDNRSDILEEITTKHPDKIFALSQAAKDGKVWDLTRLTPRIDGSASILQIAEGIHELIGTAIAETAVKTGEEPLWIFLTTATFRKFLDSSGIRHDVLYSGKISDGDYEDSYLCVADPLQAYRFVQTATQRRYQRTFASVTAGIVSQLD